mgnify:CR=1 FL=1
MRLLEFYRYTIIVLILFICSSQLIAQRQYATDSVLSKGEWYKIGITSEGVYKIDVNFLKSIGVNVANLNSSSIKLYGNGGAMLGETTNASKIDDLTEDAIEMNDGGDGVFNNNDYFMFYSAGPDKWKYDSSQHRFYHQKNLYSDTCYYFITIDSNGRRINELDNLSKLFNKSITTYNERVFHENDFENLLNSGKEWYGEYFNSQNTSQSFSINASNIDNTTAASINTSLVSRTIGGSSLFNISVNNQKAQNIVFNDVTGNLIDQYALKIKSSNTFTPIGSNFNVSVQFNPGNSLAQGWLDWFEVFFRRGLWMDNSQMGFRDANTIGTGYTRFNISNTDNTTEVWDVTDELHPVKQKTSISGSQLFFINNTDSLKEYFAFKSSAYQTPIFLNKIANQNLHNVQPADYLIITPNSFITAAQSLANFHKSYYGYTDIIAPVEQIYNEFGGGNSCPAAIRDFIKMYFDKSSINAKQLKYVLLFGLGSFDSKNRVMINKNFIPCYESDSSLNILSSYTSDDFYGILKDGESINDSTSIQLDVAVGRLPVRTLDEANNVVNKITAYHSNNSFGSWRNNISFLADNGEYNFFFNNAEQLSLIHI